MRRNQLESVTQISSSDALSVGNQSWVYGVEQRNQRGISMRTVTITEDVLLDSFRVFLGGHGANLGVKSPWWAKLMEPSEEVCVEFSWFRWVPAPHEITIAEIIVLQVVPSLSKRDREMLVFRCGKGRKTNLRKCGGRFNMSHETFRKEFQSLIGRVQKEFDKIAKI